MNAQRHVGMASVIRTAHAYIPTLHTVEKIAQTKGTFHENNHVIHPHVKVCTFYYTESQVTFLQNRIFHNC